MAPVSLESTMAGPTRGVGPPADLAREFRALAAQWVAERPRGVDLHFMTDTPACRAIIDMGPPAVPLLLAELSREVDHWFPALHAITDADPVPREARGRLKLMAAAWLKWGEEQVHIRALD